jgi:hypothetical protein
MPSTAALKIRPFASKTQLKVTAGPVPKAAWKEA